jgi:hypothetical protein
MKLLSARMGVNEIEAFGASVREDAFRQNNLRQLFRDWLLKSIFNLLGYKNPNLDTAVVSSPRKTRRGSVFGS